MLCQVGTETDLDRTDMVAELKANGTLGFLIKTETEFTIQNRRGIDYTRRLPEITQEAKEITVSYIILGEIVWTDNRGVTVFLGSQRRCGTSNPSKVITLKRQYPVKFLAFDILELNNENLRKLPYFQRKEKLLELLKQTQTILYLPHTKDKRKYYLECIAKGQEGVVLKQINSVYEDGIRSYNWLKIKQGYVEVTT